MVSSHSSTVSSSIGAHTPLTPALANTTSSRPNCALMAANSAAIAAASAVSAG
jgi:hypothetical protein